MKNKAGKPICGATIIGPKVNGRVVAWIKHCQRIVKTEFEPCWQHPRSTRIR